jgi:hypothetical protein
VPGNRSIRRAMCRVFQAVPPRLVPSPL